MFDLLDRGLTNTEVSVKQILAVALAVGLAGPAAAADVNDPYKGGVYQDTYAPSSDAWTGIYGQVFGGWGWAGWNGSYSYDDNSPDVENKWGVFDSGNKSIKDNSWFAGAGLGGDQQFDRVVLGVVVDAAYSDLNQSDTFVPYPDGGSEGQSIVSWNMETEIEAFGTARARFGYLLKPNLLVYATGGLAWAMVDSSIAPFHGEDQSGSGSNESNHIGWTLGGGGEWKLTNNVSIFGEYLYMDLGEVDYNFTGGNSYDTDNFHSDLDLHIVKVGVAYRF